MDKKQVLMKQLKPYLPIGFDEMIADLLVTYPVRFAITNPRATKLGDYRAPMQGEKFHRISVNGNLNQYSFNHNIARICSLRNLCYPWSQSETAW
jgi:hypothetical protein